MSLRRAFTLIETLVVIGIIGALVALLLPTIGMITVSAERADCGNRLRQIGAGTIAYVADQRGYLPDCTLVKPGKPANKLDPDNYWQWYELIAPYADQSGVAKSTMANPDIQANILKCPTFSMDENPFELTGGVANYFFGYAMNIRPMRYSGAIEAADWLAWYNHNDKAYVVAGITTQSFALNRVTRTDTRCFLMESNAATIEVNPGKLPITYEIAPGVGWHFDTVGDITDPDHSNAGLFATGTGSSFRWPRDRHRGRINNLYYDGHAGRWNTTDTNDGLDAMRAVCYPEYASGK
jgi:prepilin-type N-terminal cleavage/methylation domain-containing protein/prepilin-type processing-associated H-X9-DG protein